MSLLGTDAIVYFWIVGRGQLGGREREADGRLKRSGAHARGQPLHEPPERLQRPGLAEDMGRLGRGFGIRAEAHAADGVLLQGPDRDLLHHLAR